MARNQFRVDLGYGEMGPPSHLFLNELDSSAGRFNSLRRSHRDPYASDVVDTLSDQFSSMSLLRPKLRPMPALPSSLQSSRPPSLFSANLRIDGGARVYQRPKLSLGNPDPFYELHLSRLRRNESQQERARVLQRQEARLLINGGLVHRNGNVLRESVGTGVFHPLQFQRSTIETVSSVKKRYQRNRNRSEKKKLMTKEERGVMATKQQQQQDECHYHLPSDMDFSEDWTF